jgi:hypothetical protein
MLNADRYPFVSGDAVWVVQHVRTINNGEEDVKMIGVYSTEQLACEAVARLGLQPGFCDVPKGFYVERYELNKDHWTEGFITVYPIDFATTNDRSD